MVVLGAGPAAAKGWPTPAAGESASGGPELLFTFDDGPNPRTTPLVLDTLEKHHIHAVFFLVGEMAGNKNPKVAAIIHRILRDGHVIATHTMKHKDLCRVPEAAAIHDLDDGKATVEEAAGIPTAWFRAPYGARWFGLRPAQAALGLTGVMWTAIGYDWRLRADQVVNRMAVKAANGAILCLHDGRELRVKPDIGATVETVRRLVPMLLDQGYTFETVTRLICSTN